MADERTAEPPPGTPGQRALGAMESAVRRARESAGAASAALSPVARAQPASKPVGASPPPLATQAAQAVSTAPPREEQAAPDSARADATARPIRCNDASARPDRWLIRAVAVVAALVVAAAIALIVSLTSSSTLRRPRPPPRSARDDDRASPLTVDTPSSRRRANGGRPTTSTPTTSTSTTVAVTPAGPPVISSLSPSERLSRPERHGRRRQLLEHQRSDRGHLQRPGGADELPGPEHLHGHRAVVDRALGAGGDHHRGRRLECGDLHLQLSAPRSNSTTSSSDVGEKSSYHSPTA